MRLFFLLFLSILTAEICYFIPPVDWDAVQQKKPSPYLKIAYLGKGKTGFRPSMNLAIEEVECNLKEYVKAVKKLHPSDPKVSIRDLGKLEMKAGTGRLLEISNPSPFGEVKILQAILVKKKHAYILTAASLKKELIEFQKPYLKAFRSLDIVSDLWEPIEDASLQKELFNLYSNLQKGECWEAFQTKIKAFNKLGSYWQLLALKAGALKVTTGKI